ncbi:hypothetical protein BJ878DRAFT_527890 [Calycina marina]|uniref:2EXR domain-containing protein n=1 Tax=Calycina marina TaxID=1763456 RepID=A0A9P7YUQ0_9HELO|nr:hypothetical protein BJ878DRAFT_527890 [Calycina marina]
MDTTLTTFHPFPRLPKELQNAIWEDFLPCPPEADENSEVEEARRIVAVVLRWSHFKPFKMRLQMAENTDSFFDTSPCVYDLTMLATCQRSRAVFLTKFPHHLPVQSWGTGEVDAVARVYFNRETYIYIRNLQGSIVRHEIRDALGPPDEASLNSLPEWTKSVARLAYPCRTTDSILALRGHLRVDAKVLVRYFTGLEKVSYIGRGTSEGPCTVISRKKELDSLAKCLNKVHKEVTGKDQMVLPELEFIPWPWNAYDSTGKRQAIGWFMGKP